MQKIDQYTVRIEFEEPDPSGIAGSPVSFGRYWYVTQMPGAPAPRILESPHEIQVVDVTDPEQVMRAAHGMDAIINCAVVREQPAEAFRVNVVGVYNMMRAAVECDIRRIVHTGPPQGSTPHYPDPTNYAYDFDISADVPARPCVRRCEYLHTHVPSRSCIFVATCRTASFPMTRQSSYSSGNRATGWRGIGSARMAAAG